MVFDFWVKCMPYMVVISVIYLIDISSDISLYRLICDISVIYLIDISSDISLYRLICDIQYQ